MTHKKHSTSKKRHLTFTEKLEAWLFKQGISSPLIDLSIWNNSGAFSGFGHYDEYSVKFITKFDKDSRSRRLLIYSDNGILLKEITY